MKKTFLIFLAIISLGCSSSDDNEEKNCNERVFGTSRTCNPEPNCVFKVKHGPVTGDTWTENEEVDEQTYNYYDDLYQKSIENESDVCWEE